MGETINGFDIPKRELTTEEASRNITVERIRNFHYGSGEDFLDTTSEGNAQIFAGWLLHKYPEKSKEILAVVNNNGKYLVIADFNEIEDFEKYDDEIDMNSLYIEFVEFCNQTEHLKRRVNQVLIQVDEYYNGR